MLVEGERQIFKVVAGVNKHLLLPESLIFKFN
jgi:hypothetical protein